MKKKIEKYIINALATFMVLSICFIIVGAIFIGVFFISEYFGGFWAFITLIAIISLLIALFIKE